VVRELKIGAQRYKSGLHIHKATINTNSDEIIMNEYIIYIITEGFWGFGVIECSFGQKFLLLSELVL
jgi:hypothetical protein